MTFMTMFKNWSINELRWNFLIVEDRKYRNSFWITLWFFQILRWLRLQSSDISPIGKSCTRDWFKPSKSKSWQSKRQKYSNRRAIWWNQYRQSCLSDCKLCKNKIHISSYWKNSCKVPRKWIRLRAPISICHKTYEFKSILKNINLWKFNPKFWFFE